MESPAVKEVVQEVKFPFKPALHINPQHLPTNPKSTAIKLFSVFKQSSMIPQVPEVMFVFMLVCVLMVAAVVLYLYLAWFWAFLSSSRTATRSQQQQQQPQPQPQPQKSQTDSGLSSSELAKLPRFVYSELSFCCSNSDCAVCLDIFNGGDQCLQIPGCHHIFHVKCAQAWLCRRPFCPTCRGSAYPPPLPAATAAASAKILAPADFSRSPVFPHHHHGQDHAISVHDTNDA